MDRRVWLTEIIYDHFWFQNELISPKNQIHIKKNDRILSYSSGVFAVVLWLHQPDLEADSQS